MVYSLPPLKELRDCVSRRNLYLVRNDFFWVVLRVSGRKTVPGGAVRISDLLEFLQTSDMVTEIRKLESVEDIQEYMNCHSMSDESLIGCLNKPLAEKGYEVIMSAAAGI